MGRGRGRSIPGSVLPPRDQLIQDLFGPDYSVSFRAEQLPMRIVALGGMRWSGDQQM